MPIAPGEVRNPNGRPKKGRLFADAIESAVKDKDPATGQRKLRRIADKVVDMAVEGDVNAIREVANRLDGKAASQHEHSHVLSIGDEVLMALRELANRPREMKAIDNEDPDSN